MLNLLTGLEITKRADDGMIRSSFTGTLIKKSEEVPASLQDSARPVKKSNGSLWPSLDCSLDFSKSDDGDGDDVEMSVEDFKKWRDEHKFVSKAGVGDAFSMFVPFVKSDTARQIVYGVIYAPDVKDSAGDSASSEEIELAAHDFLANSRVLKLQHAGKQIKAEIVESYISPDDFTLGKEKITKGTWVMAAHISDKKLWGQIVAGELTGFSMGGTASAA